MSDINSTPKFREKDLQQIITSHFPKLGVDLSKFKMTQIAHRVKGEKPIFMLDFLSSNGEEGFTLIQGDGKYSESRDRIIEKIVTGNAFDYIRAVQFFYQADADFPAGYHWVKDLNHKPGVNN